MQIIWPDSSQTTEYGCSFIQAEPPCSREASPLHLAPPFLSRSMLKMFVFSFITLPSSDLSSSQNRLGHLSEGLESRRSDSSSASEFFACRSKCLIQYSSIHCEWNNEARKWLTACGCVPLHLNYNQSHVACDPFKITQCQDYLLSWFLAPFDNHLRPLFGAEPIYKTPSRFTDPRL